MEKVPIENLPESILFRYYYEGVLSEEEVTCVSRSNPSFEW